MRTRNEFCLAIVGLDLSVVDRAVALLWYYRETQTFDERSARELGNDLVECGFAAPNFTRLRNGLSATRQTVKGSRPGTFKVSPRHVAELGARYSEYLQAAPVLEIAGAVLPSEQFAGTRLYLEKMAYQINACYETGLYDGAAVLCRRLMESLIIEIYIHLRRVDEIRRADGAFLMLDPLIRFIRSDTAVTLGRNAPSTMEEVKAMGDTAAHHRTYITQQIDLDDIKAKYRRLIAELLQLAGITT
jgi:hypothetical protein